MNDERDLRRESRRAALLDELRCLHRADGAPEGLRQRVLDQAERGPAAFAPRFNPFWRALGSARRIAGLGRLGAAGPRLALAALAALGLGLVLRSASPGAPAGERAAPLGNGGALALGPEPKSPALRPPSAGSSSAASTAPPAGEVPDPRELPFDARETRTPEQHPSGAHGANDAVGMDRAARPEPCPLAQVPPGALIVPGKLGAPGLRLHTFVQQTFTCGPLTRRYLERLSPGLPQRSKAPVLILLHDAGESAETLYARKESLDFERVAQQNAAVVIYANAAPGRASNDRVANSGAWHTDPRTHLEVDDLDYLTGILTDLAVRHVIDGSNDVFLVGYGDGAAMALDAAERRPGYAGVVAFTLSNQVNVEPGRSRIEGRLSRVMLVLDASSPWRAAMPALARRWASALGMEQKVIGSRWSSGAAPKPLSSVERFDVALPATGSSAVRLYIIDGDLERPPGALHAWDFLTGVEGADPDVPDDLPDLPEVPVEPLFADGESVTERDADGYEKPSLVLEQEVVPAPAYSVDGAR